MDGIMLGGYLKEHKIALPELAEKTGYNLAYLLQIIRGHAPFTDSAKFKIIMAYPRLADALMEKEAGA